MVASIPQTLRDKYGRWTGRIPRDVLSALTLEQLGARLQRAQDRWNAALGPDGDGDLQGAMSDAEEILAAPVAGAKPPGKETSALKAAGLTGADMDRYGRWLSRIPDDVLVKMDRPAVLKRAELAAAEHARTGSVEAADRILTAPAYVMATEPMTKAAHAAYRRGVREDLARQYGDWIGDVPDEVLGKLDAAELVDRCEYVKGLEARGKANPHPGMIHGYLDWGRQVMRALPRAEVAAEVARLEKAAMLTDEPRLAQGYRAQARQVREANPQAPVVERPAWLGKALRAPEPRTSPGVLHKAEGAGKKPQAAKKTPVMKAPAKRKPTMSKADAVRVGAGLDALLAALELLKANPDLNKADDRTQRTVDGLLEVADEAFNR